MVIPFLRTYGPLYLVALWVAIYSALYEVVGIQPSGRAEFTFHIATGTFLAMWVRSDARARKCTPCFDFDTFVFFTCVVSVPGYLFATRGWRGLMIVLSIVGVFIVSMLFVIVLGTIFISFNA